MTETLKEELRPPLSAAEALVEADRCLACGGPHAAAPCARPAPPRSTSRASSGDRGRRPGRGAAKTIFAENLLGGTCARVCPVEVLCEGACVLAHEAAAPIAIGALQRFATDAALADRRAVMRVTRPAERPGAVAVVGAGPAGMACAGELAALGLRTSPSSTSTTRSAGSSATRSRRTASRATRCPPRRRRSRRSAWSSGSARRLGAPGADARRGGDAIFLGVGLGADSDVAYPGDDLAGRLGLAAVHRGAQDRGAAATSARDVVVIGGGNTAIDVAREALRLGAEKVTIVYRRTRAEMPAYPHEVDEARRRGRRFSWLADPVRFLGDAPARGGRVPARCVSASPTTSGRRRPEPIAGSEFMLRADTV